jgi:hypothetical protein
MKMREKTEWISFRVPVNWFRQVEDWMRHQVHIPTRATAVRALVELGLESTKKRPAAA